MADEVPKKRRFRRIAAEHAVMVTGVTGAGTEALEEFARLQDLGLGGCMFLSDESIAPGSVIEVLISLAGRVVPTTARVVYQHPSDRRFEIGVEFLRLAADDREFLQSSFDDTAGGQRLIEEDGA